MSNNQALYSSFYIGHAIITRRCNFSCPYCRISRVSTEIMKKELEPLEWSNIIKTYQDTLGTFFVITGGEPLVYKGNTEKIIELVRLLKGYKYTIQSNSMLLTENLARKLVESGLHGFSVSIDYPPENKDPRSMSGYKALSYFNKYKIYDLHTTVTLYPWNIEYLPRIVSEIIKYDSWIEINFAFTHNPTDNNLRYYSLFKPLDPKIWDKENVIKILKKTDNILKINGYKKIHFPISKIIENIDLFLGIRQFYCEKPEVIVIDYDGNMRLCYHIEGNKVRRWGSMLAIKYLEDFVIDWIEDRIKFCNGCNWECPITKYLGLDKEGFYHVIPNR